MSDPRFASMADYWKGRAGQAHATRIAQEIFKRISPESMVKFQATIAAAMDADFRRQLDEISFNREWAL